jgi:hypothetical protein
MEVQTGVEGFHLLIDDFSETKERDLFQSTTIFETFVGDARLGKRHDTTLPDDMYRLINIVRERLFPNDLVTPTSVPHSRTNEGRMGEKESQVFRTISIPDTSGARVSSGLV